MWDNRKLTESKQARERAVERASNWTSKQASASLFFLFLTMNVIGFISWIPCLTSSKQWVVTWICKARKSFAHDVAFVRVPVTSLEVKLEQRVVREAHCFVLPRTKQGWLFYFFKFLDWTQRSYGKSCVLSKMFYVNHLISWVMIVVFRGAGS